MSYSAEIERALLVCMDAHSGQFRKGGDGVAYAVHPIHMAMILSSVGASDTVVQAALLHDVVEDCEEWTPERLEAEFGSAVASIVADLTEDKSMTWEERKRAAIDHINHMQDDSVLVKAADKLHNLESLAAQLEVAEKPGKVWSLFNGGRERTLAMDRELVMTLQGRAPALLAEQLGAAFARVERLA